jgi:hypothetical protein
MNILPEEGGKSQVTVFKGYGPSSVLGPNGKTSGIEGYEVESNERKSWKKVGKEVYVGLEDINQETGRDDEDEVEYQFEGLERRGVSP